MSCSRAVLAATVLAGLLAGCTSSPAHTPGELTQVSGSPQGPPRTTPPAVKVTGPEGAISVTAAGPVAGSDLYAYQDLDGTFSTWDSTGPIPDAILEDVTARVGASTIGFDRAAYISPAVAALLDPHQVDQPGATLSADVTAAAEAVLIGTGKHLVTVVPPVMKGNTWAVIGVAAEYTVTAAQPDQASARSFATAFIASQPAPGDFLLIDLSPEETP